MSFQSQTVADEPRTLQAPGLGEYDAAGSDLTVAGWRSTTSSESTAGPPLILRRHETDETLRKLSFVKVYRFQLPPSQTESRHPQYTLRFRLSTSPQSY